MDLGAEFSFFTEIFNLQNVERTWAVEFEKPVFIPVFCSYESLEESISYKMRVTSQRLRMCARALY